MDGLFRQKRPHVKTPLFGKFKDLHFYIIKELPLPHGTPGRPRANHNELIMNSLQGVIRWSHEGFGNFPDKISIFILVKEILCLQVSPFLVAFSSGRC